MWLTVAAGNDNGTFGAFAMVALWVVGGEADGEASAQWKNLHFAIGSGLSLLHYRLLSHEWEWCACLLTAKKPRPLFPFPSLITVCCVTSICPQLLQVRVAMTSSGKARLHVIHKFSG